MQFEGAQQRLTHDVERDTRIGFEGEYVTFPQEGADPVSVSTNITLSPKGNAAADLGELAQLAAPFGGVKRRETAAAGGTHARP